MKVKLYVCDKCDRVSFYTPYGSNNKFNCPTRFNGEHDNIPCDGKRELKTFVLEEK